MAKPLHLVLEGLAGWGYILVVRKSQRREEPELVFHLANILG